MAPSKEMSNVEPEIHMVNDGKQKIEDTARYL